MPDPSTNNEIASRTIRKVAWRLIPFMGLLYLVAFLDRVNIGFAALTMNADLGLTPSMFGLASGIFFLGYVLFEVPSNVMLERFGARLWIARIMISWGVLSAATAFVSAPTQLYVLRFLLGVAEAGFFPGMILYLTYWFPAPYRARILSAFMVALPVSSVIGGPLSTAILTVDGAGLRGWQWMFLIEGVPAVLLGVAVLIVLRDRPSRAAWLADDERQWLEEELERERSLHPAHQRRLVQALGNSRVWALGLVYFGMIVGLYAFNFWLPQMIQALGRLSTSQVGLAVAVPYAIAAVVMMLWGRRSDAKAERTWHIATPAFIGAAGLAASAQLTDSPLLGAVALSVSAIGTFAALPVFWTLPTSMLSGSAAAAGIALINSIGNIGGFLGPTLVGYVRDATGSYSASLWVLAALIAFSGVAVIVLSARMSSDKEATPRLQPAPQKAPRRLFANRQRSESHAFRKRS
jgi:ACS family tartrate transporter-like MFS transporter